MKSNINSVRVIVSPTGHTLVANISTGIHLDIVEDGVPIGFTMRSTLGEARWLNRKNLGVTDGGNTLLTAGFYTVAKTGHYKGEPFWRNISYPKDGGYEHDREVMFEFIPQCGYEWEIWSPDGYNKDETWGDCLNYPKLPEKACGKWLVRIPDGAFMRVETEGFGCICVLNIKGKLTMHPGTYPNSNTYHKAMDAAYDRYDFMTGVDQSPDEFQENILEKLLTLDRDQPLYETVPVIQAATNPAVEEKVETPTPPAAETVPVKKTPARRKKPTLKDVVPMTKVPAMA